MTSGPMFSNRTNVTAALLGNGTVLSASGFDSSSLDNSAKIFHS